MSGKHMLQIPTIVIENWKGGKVAKSKNQDQAQLVQAIGYFKALKKQAPKNNPKILEELDRAEGDLKDALFELLESKTSRPPVNL